MRRPKKTTFWISMILLCIVFLSLCGHKGPSYAMLHATASYSIPGMIQYDTMSTPIEIIEQDKYGRTLFSYTVSDMVTGQERTVWVICQKATKKKTYYYEDFNYSFTDDSEAIESLKQQNDWGDPLEEQKYSVRQPKFTWDSSMLVPGSDLDVQKISSAIFRKFHYTKVSSAFCDADGHGNELWYYELEKGGTVQEFFVIVNSKYQTELFEIVDDTFLPEELHQFKTDNGWVF